MAKKKENKYFENKVAQKNERYIFKTTYKK